MKLTPLFEARGRILLVLAMTEVCTSQRTALDPQCIELGMCNKQDGSGEIQADSYVSCLYFTNRI